MDKNKEMNPEIIEDLTLDEERALYGKKDMIVRKCSFDGPADGESALKECQDVTVEKSFFNLRYPFWHDDRLTIKKSEMTELCRAALWYCRHVDISDSKLHGIKALRECSDIHISGSDIVSPEFGWNVHTVSIEDSAAESEYFMMGSSDLALTNVKFRGKYSFQYVRNMVIENCELDTKDAFWHTDHVTVRNSVVKGEYLGWYSDHLTFENCKIIGTQPLCYCKNLTLINCEMVDTDLCFERSEVQANITTPVLSIKNPLRGRITVPSVGEIIRDIEGADCEIVTVQ